MRRLAPLVVLIAGACTGASAPVKRPAPRDDSGAFVTPARWAYHPAAPKAGLAVLELDDGACLLTAAGGQRWLTPPDAEGHRAASSGPRACSGRGAAASAVAPEDLVAIARTAKGEFLFAGESGKLYFSEQPLEKFTRTLAPGEPIHFVATSPCHAPPAASSACDAAGLLGVTPDGGLYRWTELKGFAAIAAGDGARFVDVAADAAGHALALALPEALFSSEDAGATWSKRDAPTIGARRLGRARDGGLAAQGLFESLVWSGGATTTRTRAAAVAEPAATSLDAGHAPNAAAVLEQRAAIDGDRYVELVPPKTPKGAFLLSRGKLDGSLDVAPLAQSTGCASARVALRGSVVAVACVRPRDDHVLEATVRRSFDFGATFGDPISLRANEPAVSGIAASVDGAVLLAGVCRSADAAHEDECKTHAPVLIRGDATHPVAITVSAEQLVGDAALLAFSFDGRSAYFVGKRGKDERMAIFVSHDGAETFAQRPLVKDAVDAHEPVAHGDDDDDGPAEHESESGSDDLDVDDKSSFLVASEDGTLTLGLHGAGPMLVGLDEDGRIDAARAAPEGAVALGGYGRRAVALAPSDAHPLALFESSDGGATWEETSAPLAVDGLGQDAAIACGASGCVLGDTLTRVGWGGSVEARKPTPDAEPPHEGPPATPIVCELAASKPWSRIEHVHGIDAGEGLLPSGREAMRGRAAWSVLTFDPATGAATTVVATLPESGEGEPRVATKSLLGPAGSSHFAVSLTHAHQVEGYLVARANVPVDAKGAFAPGGPMRRVEVAWENFDDGSSGRTRIADAGVFERGDVETHDGLMQLQVSMGSVTLKSTYLMPHHAHSLDDIVYLLRSNGAEERVKLPRRSDEGGKAGGRWPAKGLTDALVIHDEEVTLEGAPFGVGLVAESGPEGSWWSSILLARADAKASDVVEGFRVTTTAIAPVRGASANLIDGDWTYVGANTVGVVTTTSDIASGRAWAYFNPFRADGAVQPAVAVPTVGDVGDRPRPCAKVDRESTPRVHASAIVGKRAFFPNALRAVLISEPPATPQPADSGRSPPLQLELVSSSAILHGTPGSPCVAAFDAATMPSPNAALSAIVAGDLTHAWLFRRALPEKAKKPAGKPFPPAPAIEWRAMSCRYDPKATVPDELSRVIRPPR